MNINRSCLSGEEGVVVDLSDEGSTSVEEVVSVDSCFSVLKVIYLSPLSK